MEVGLDFDGVFIDTSLVKSKLALALYGVYIPPEQFKREVVVGCGLLTDEQYTKVSRTASSDLELTLSMPPLPNSVYFTNRLLHEGHGVRVVTSRDGYNAWIAMQYMLYYGLFLTLSGVGYRIPKTDACRGLDFYADDDLDKLIPLVGIVPRLYLFSWPYNSHLTIPSNITGKTYSWSHIYSLISGRNVV
ncbi:hypothetical protein J4216_00425 [Candidatus Woesearchaeota archaeon]|nr:hypothetical protein [Candidatus Woesearchaeota archaeon]